MVKTTWTAFEKSQMTVVVESKAVSLYTNVCDWTEGLEGDCV